MSLRRVSIKRIPLSHSSQFPILSRRCRLCAKLSNAWAQETHITTDHEFQTPHSARSRTKGKNAKGTPQFRTRRTKVKAGAVAAAARVGVREGESAPRSTRRKRSTESTKRRRSPRRRRSLKKRRRRKRTKKMGLARKKTRASGIRTSSINRTATNSQTPVSVSGPFFIA